MGGRNDEGTLTIEKECGNKTKQKKQTKVDKTRQCDNKGQ